MKNPPLLKGDGRRPGDLELCGKETEKLKFRPRAIGTLTHRDMHQNS